MMQSHPNILIDFQEVTRDINASKGKTKRLLSNVSWQLHKGQRIGVISGSMQEANALLDCAAGITTPQQGNVSIQSHVSWPLGTRGGMLNGLTGRENACFLQGVYGHGGRQRQDLDQVQFLADLEDGYFDKPLKSYNKFMRARFNLAIGLAFDFDVYIIPKQFAWKSNPSSERLINLQQALKEKTIGKSVLMNNTDFDFIAEFCDEGVVLEQGKIVYTGSFADCRAWYNININRVPEEDVALDRDIEDTREPITPDTTEPDDGLW